MDGWEDWVWVNGWKKVFGILPFVGIIVSYIEDEVRYREDGWVLAVYIYTWCLPYSLLPFSKVPQVYKRPKKKT